jgi:hypothetical protein
VILSTSCPAYLPLVHRGTDVDGVHREQVKYVLVCVFLRKAMFLNDKSGPLQKGARNARYPL